MYWVQFDKKAVLTAVFKGALAGTGVDPAIVWFLFNFSFKTSALVHLATAPPKGLNHCLT